MQFLVSNPRGAFVLYTNRKVMSSTLEQLSIERSNNIELRHKIPLRHVACEIHSIRGRLLGIGERMCQDYGGRYPRYLLVRHPLRRLESLYHNLVLSERIKHLSHRHQLTDDNIRMIATIPLAPLLHHIYGKQQGERIRKSAQIQTWLPFNTWIEEMFKLINASPNYRRLVALDHHLKSQYLVLHPRYTRLIKHCPIAIKCDRIIKIDDKEDHDFLSQKLGLQDYAHQNRSDQNANIETSWSPRARQMAIDYYRRDFELFNYSPE